MTMAVHLLMFFRKWKWVSNVIPRHVSKKLFYVYLHRFQSTPQKYFLKPICTVLSQRIISLKKRQPWKRAHTDKKILENFPPMWGRDWVQSHMEGKISQFFPPKYREIFPLSQRIYGPGPGSTPGCDKKKVKFFSILCRICEYLNIPTTFLWSKA